MRSVNDIKAQTSEACQRTVLSITDNQISKPLNLKNNQSLREYSFRSLNLIATLSKESRRYDI